MRSARAALLLATLALVLVPLGALLVSGLYEWWLVSSYQARLASIAQEAQADWPAQQARLPALARKYGVVIRVIGPDGAAAETAPGSDGNPEEESFWVRGPFESLSDLFPFPPQREALADAEKTFGPLLEREELVSARAGRQGFGVHFSPSGETAALVVASLLPDGHILTVTKASHRGVRRLLSLRREMTRVALYQATAALAVGLLLGRWLVRPLKKLATAAARYPREPLATPDLLARQDELGQLARSMAGLASSLEQRRRETVDRAADLAHEFKNPLATIIAAAEHLGTTRALSDDKRALLAEVSATAAKRLLTVTEALLSLARLEAALPQEPREEIDYRAFLEELLAVYRKDTRWADHELHLEVGAGVGRISVVPAAWEKLLTNLLDNALIQPAQPRRVELVVTATADAVVTSVKDHGPGVSPGNRDKIFRRFFTDRPQGVPAGTGLGLSIVQAIADAHGAKVELAPASGEGATFVVTLPRHRPA